MGITCRINITKPNNGVFPPSSTVSGSIEYNLDEPTKFKDIIVSLKGHGYFVIKDKHRDRRSNSRRVFRNSEEYVDIDTIVKNGTKILPGTYEIPFDFKLPEQIPSSLKLYLNSVRYKVACEIKYYIRIKFNTPGLSFAKRFKKEISVVSDFKPSLPTEPTIYGEVKKLIHIFSMSKSVVEIKAKALSSVVKPGQKVSIEYDIINNSKVNINSVETKLIEVWSFTLKGGRMIIIVDEVKDTDSKMGSIQCGASRHTTLDIPIPNNGFSIANSKIVGKDYAVIINVGLPMPHRDAVLKIPVQVGDDTLTEAEDSPPSYWEVMGEDIGKREGDDDDYYEHSEESKQ